MKWEGPPPWHLPLSPLARAPWLPLAVCLGPPDVRRPHGRLAWACTSLGAVHFYPGPSKETGETLGFHQLWGRSYHSLVTSTAGC